ncbi:MAG: TSUP family transporter [Christensenellales bacterium]|jgi:D-alanyl-D-alanine carboxypeptidase
MIEIALGVVFGIMGGMGIGGGAVLIPALVIISGMEQHAAQGISLVAFLPAALAAAVVHIRHKRINWKAAGIMCLAGAATAGLGAVFSNGMPVDALRYAFGVFLLMLAAWQLFSIIKKGREKARDERNASFLVLVNAHNALREEKPDVSGDWGREKGFSLDKEVLLRPEALDAARRMFKRASLRGLYFIAVSGYRSVEYQAKLFEKKTETIMRINGLNRLAAEAEAAKIVARPGHSEHNTGLALDVAAKSMAGRKDVLTDDFKHTREGKWLKRNAHRFGFIMRYPAEKQHITGIQSEPWHIRYIGLPHSRIIHRRGICLEEYEAAVRQGIKAEG